MYIRKHTSLNGLWDFSIPGGKSEKRMVPGSYDCVGDSVYRLRVALQAPDAGKRVNLCFEGIAYEGTVFFNGNELGTMLPYSFYCYDITEFITAGENEIELQLQDLNAVFGPSEGWKSYSGIIRPVFLEEAPEVSLEDVFFTTTFAEQYLQAFCNLDIAVRGCADGHTIRARLLQNGLVCAEAPAVAASTGNLKMEVSHPLLWSPENPVLYQLEVELLQNGVVTDAYHCNIGFKDLTIKGSKFLLNGKDLFITGVCRHDLWTDSVAFTQTDDMIETDLRMMKHMGVNYVRLVHYPHDRRVVEACDRIGLLCSEEPGLWWSDLSNKAITTRALQVLENVIYRDRNHVSIAFWMSFNECIFDEEFLRDTVVTARRCDPSRLISGANCNDIYQTKELYDKYGMDFYTMHPYGPDINNVNGGTLQKCCEVLSGKPLIFTEWGGYFVHENPNLFMEFCETMRRLHMNEAPNPVLAGMSYWQWQDIPEAQRGYPACTEGILTEGLVSVDRKPKTNFYTYMAFLDQLRRPLAERLPEVSIVGAGNPDHVYESIVLPRPEVNVWEEAVKESTPMPGYHHKRNRRITRGPVLPFPIARLGSLQVDMPAGQPVVLSTSSGAIEIPINRKANALWFVGQATMGKGYPINGQRSTVYGSYVISYADGTEETIVLHDGEESATVFGLIGPTAFDPRATKTTRAFTIDFDRNWEVYHAGLIRIPTGGKEVISVRAQVSAEGYFLLLYGMSAEM